VDVETFHFATRTTASLWILGSGLDDTVCLSWEIMRVKPSLGDPTPIVVVWSRGNN
jgi:hypothetical protein